MKSKTLKAKTVAKPKTEAISIDPPDRAVIRALASAQHVQPADVVKAALPAYLATRPDLAKIAEAIRAAGDLQAVG